MTPDSIRMFDEIGAGRASTDHREVMRIDGEAILHPHSACERGKERIGNLDGVPALATHEVAMRKRGEMIGRGSMPKVRMLDDTEPF